MHSLIPKMVICPLVLILAEYSLPNVKYTNIYQPIAIGFILALTEFLMELFTLRRGTFWINNFLDFAAAFIIIYASQYFFPRAFISLPGALIAAFFISTTEYFQHLVVLRQQEVKEHGEKYKSF